MHAQPSNRVHGKILADFTPFFVKGILFDILHPFPHLAQEAPNAKMKTFSALRFYSSFYAGHAVSFFLSLLNCHPSFRALMPMYFMSAPRLTFVSSL